MHRFAHLRFNTIDTPPEGGGSPEPEGNQPTGTAGEQPQTGDLDWKAEAEKWKAMSRKHEQNEKTNADKARRFDELEEQSKTELQKAQEAAAKSQAEAEALRLENMKARIALEKNVPVELLAGNNEDTIRASADKALEWRGITPPATPPASTSSQDAGNRGEPISGEQQLSQDDLKNMTPHDINEARKAGRLDQLMGVATHNR
jgi:hypothetical protein